MLQPLSESRLPLALLCIQERDRDAVVAARPVEGVLKGVVMGSKTSVVRHRDLESCQAISSSLVMMKLGPPEYACCRRPILDVVAIRDLQKCRDTQKDPTWRDNC